MSGRLRFSITSSCEQTYRLDLVYEITSVIFDSTRELAAAHPAATDIKLDARSTACRFRCMPARRSSSRKRD